MQTLTIHGRQIGPGFPPYIIAELSANHNGKIENALTLIDEAKKAGADAIKLQTYRPDTITLNCDREEFKIHHGLWKGRTLYELYTQAHMPWEWHRPLFDHAKKIGLTIFSSPFDETAVDLLQELEAPAFKVASFEAIDLPLIRYIAKTKKPMIISTGMASQQEIQEAIDTAKSNGCTQLAILHCVSGYPAPAEEYNLRTIPDMINTYKVVTGLSDHTTSNATAIASVSLGASIVEKHFTLNRNGGGPDDSFSLEPKELASLCIDAKTAWMALGNVNYERSASEKENLKFRRSLYYIKDLPAGSLITKDCIKSVRPGYGLAPKYLDQVIGKTTKMPVTFGSPVTQDSFE